MLDTVNGNRLYISLIPQMDCFGRSMHADFALEEECESRLKKAEICQSDIICNQTHSRSQTLAEIVEIQDKLLLLILVSHLKPIEVRLVKVTLSSLTSLIIPISKYIKYVVSTADTSGDTEPIKQRFTEYICLILNNVLLLHSCKYTIRSLLSETHDSY